MTSPAPRFLGDGMTRRHYSNQNTSDHIRKDTLSSSGPEMAVSVNQRYLQTLSFD